MRVEQAVDPAFRDRSDLGRGDRQEVGGECQGFTVEVAVGLHVAVLEHDWIVDRRRQLDLSDAAREIERVSGGAGDLRAAPHGVGVLHRVLRMAVRRHDLRILHQQ